MTLTQLEYIVAIDRYRHFAVAAEKCNVTQPTLSVQVQKLENELKLMLFDRTKQPVVPTEDGIRILLKAKEVLAAASSLKETVMDVREEVEGELRLAILPSLAPYLLPLFLLPFSRKYPQIKVEVMELHTYQILGRLHHDTADVGITAGPVKEEGFYEIPIFKEPISVYVSPKHPLAEKEVLELTDVDLSELILTDDNRGMANTIASMRGEDGFETQLKNIVYRSGSVETIRKIVEREGGITLLPKLASLYMGERRRKYVRNFIDPTPERQIQLVTQRGFQKQRLIDALYEEIKACLPKDLTS